MKYRLIPIALLLPMLVACATYDSQPLAAAEMLAELLAADEESAVPPKVSLAQAALAMRQHHPAVVAAWSEHRLHSALAEISTPLVNPGLNGGPLFFDSAAVTGNARYGIEAALSLVLPLTPERRVMDELAALQATATLVTAESVEQQAYLELRDGYVQLALQYKDRQFQDKVLQAATVLQEVQRKLVEQADGTVLDLLLAVIQRHSQQAATMQTEEGRLALAGKLAQHSGLPLQWFAGMGPVPLPDLPETAPDLEACEKLLLQTPSMRQLQQDYLLAEKQLHLQVLRQYPHWGLGASYERENGANRFGLPLDLEIPLFDRNQKGVAEAEGRRAQAREIYATTLRQSVRVLQTSHSLLLVRLARLQYLQENMQPLLQKLSELLPAAREGGLDSLSELLVLQQMQTALAGEFAAQRSVYESWLELERACGVPLLEFSTQSEEAEESEESKESEGAE